MKQPTRDTLLVASRQELTDTVLSLQSKVEELSFQLEWLKRQIFGTKSERFVADDDMQVALELDIVNNGELSGGHTVTPVSFTREGGSTKKQQPGHGRNHMPEHLPIKDRVIEPEIDITGMVRIGEEVSWHYEMTPGSLHIVRTIRPKYVRRGEDGVAIGTLPPLPIDKGNAGPGLMAQIITDKYVYHVPLDRQRKKFKSEYDVDFSESWLCDNVKNGTFWLKYVYDAYVKKVLASRYLQADETPIQVLTRDIKGKTHRGYFWVYHDPIERIVIFDYRKSRAKEGPADFLKTFKGALQVDGYDGYGGIITANSLMHAGCMDHVRRRFEKALDYDKNRATYALEIMREWYGVEKDARENKLSAQDRLALRKEKTVSSMNDFGMWLRREITAVLPKSIIGNAIQYALNQWPYFVPFMTDGTIELSNILIENALRPVALGRKNFLFAGSHDAARWPAVIYTIAATAKLHGIDANRYITELLTELPQIDTSQVASLLLPAWKPAVT
jgi:transposase